MKPSKIAQLPLGTKLFRIRNGNISIYKTLCFHPTHNQYFYLVSDANVSDTVCFYLPTAETKVDDIWETDYEQAKELLWKQTVENTQSINSIWMDGKKTLIVDISNGK